MEDAIQTIELLTNRGFSSVEITCGGVYVFAFKNNKVHVFDNKGVDVTSHATIRPIQNKKGAYSVTIKDYNNTYNINHVSSPIE